MSRSGCFEILTSCPGCGQSVPVNGPFRSLLCSGCFETFSIPDRTITGFLNNFEEEFTNLAEGDGSGGTMISGAGTFTYGYWRLAPRCIECRKPLKLPEYTEDSEITCQCGKIFQVYPAAEWLLEHIPSIRQFISIEREIVKEKPVESVIRTNSQELFVITCPRCGGTLSIGAGNERVMKCNFCKSEVYIPDAIWTRLHPVKKTQEWFALFDGKTARQILDGQRLIDEKEQKESLKILRPRRLRKLPMGKRIRWLLIILGILALFHITAGIMQLAGASPEKIGSVIGTMTMIALGIVFLAITLGSTFYMEISYRWGYPGRCRKAMEGFAARHNWKHQGREHKHYMGSIESKLRGCEFKIHPDNNYAIEVSLDDSDFYLKTESPAYPPDDLLRFTTDDQRFNDLFPIRYAKPSMIRRLKIDQEDILKPFHWFLDRWEDKLAKIKVDRSDLKAHLAPGHKTRFRVAVRFIYPEDLEPFFEDMITLAKAIDSVAKGKKPELPEAAQKPPQVT